MNSKYFTGKKLVKKWDLVTVDVSIELEKSQMLAIAGKSGSGKSTVLRIIAGLTPQSRYEALMLDGIDIGPLSPGRRGVGMVFQNHALFPHMRLDDNVAYGLRSRGMGKKEGRNKAAEMLERFGLSGFSHRYPASLSGGEAQRVSLARTLIIEPKLVLFDEPLSSLDAPLRKSLALDIRQRQRELGFTGILVTHDIAEVKTMSDAVLVMKDGKQTWGGSPEDFTESLLL